MQIATQLGKILFVDDEPNVLDGIRRQLRGLYDVHTATSGLLGLAALESAGPFAVIVSDMQMPGMNGAAFLREARKRCPESVRMLLTGHADINAAIDAVNEGHVFRFLRKPCPPSELQLALAGAVEHHRLVAAEKELLERTLRGSVEALSETLALASPKAFGASMRIRGAVGDIARAMKLPNVWELEIAATMAQLGVVTLPDALIEKLASGAPLDRHEQALVLQLPGIVDRVLAKIPRLEGVREMVRTQHAHFQGGGMPPELKGAAIPIGGRILRAATDLDALESAGVPTSEALEKMRAARPCLYDPAVLDAFEAAREARPPTEVRELPLDELRPGMIFARDVKLANGLLLVARGLLATPTLLSRLRAYQDSLSSDRVGVR